MLANIDSLDSYLTQYGPLLGRSSARTLTPLHVPGRDKPIELDFKREPFDPQGHAATAAAKALENNPAVLLVAECGTGKTIMAMATIHAAIKLHGKGKPYRVLVFCPPTLAKKWQREIEETVPGATVVQLRSFRQLTRLDRRSRPTGPEFWIVKETTAKDGAAWEPAFTIWKTRKGHSSVAKSTCPQCPSCGRLVVNKKGNPIPPKELAKRRLFCVGTEENPGCGSPLWTYNGSTKKWAPATYIKKHLRGFFDYLVVDEIHEENSPTSARANAMGTLAAACRKVIGLTGTLVGGYAWHLRTLVLRIAPQSLTAEGLHWSNVTDFNRRYGRMETKVVTIGDAASADNKRSKGSQRSHQKAIPGIMPTLFGRHLIDKCVFLSLDELSDNLPPFEEILMPVKMDRQLADAYQKTEDALRDAVKQMIARNDRRLLSAMLDCLLTYPDMPYGWDEVGYWQKIETAKGIQNHFIPVVQPPDLGSDLREKEKALVEAILAEHGAGRQCWVYVTCTNKHDVAGRVERALRDAKLKARVLRSSVSTDAREDWINENAPKLDVVISHPRLVRTGLDLFDKRGRHNFPSLFFHETGYDLFTLRQAARRSWRIGQHLPCKVFYSFYQGTMQDRAMTLMGRKLVASEAIEGKFSSEGLAAMSGEDDESMQIALARSLVNRMDDLDTDRVWSKISRTLGNPNFHSGAAPTAPSPVAASKTSARKSQPKQAIVEATPPAPKRRITFRESFLFD